MAALLAGAVGSFSGFRVSPFSGFFKSRLGSPFFGSNFLDLNSTFNFAASTCLACFKTSLKDKRVFGQDFGAGDGDFDCGAELGADAGLLGELVDALLLAFTAGLLGALPAFDVFKTFVLVLLLAAEVLSVGFEAGWLAEATDDLAGAFDGSGLRGAGAFGFGGSGFRSWAAFEELSAAAGEGFECGAGFGIAGALGGGARPPAIASISLKPIVARVSLIRDAD